MKNTYIELQIMNMELAVRNMLPALQADAMKDDGKMDIDEKKIIEEIRKANDRYLKDLKRIREKY